MYRKVDPYRPFGGAQAEAAIAECRDLERSIDYRTALFRAHRGVVIAAGNYTYNLELLSRYRPEFAICHREMNRGGSMGCDGSGLELGLSAGGQLANMDAVALMRSVSPPNAYVAGMLVNARGERYINEDAYLGHIGLATADQPDYVCWLILDAKTFWKGIRQLLPPKEMFSWWGMPAWLNILLGGTKRGASIEKLARKCGIPAEALRATLDTYNAGVAKGVDRHGKKPANMSVLEGGFYAINCSFRNKWSFSSGMPFGGLKVNEKTGAVVTGEGASVPGLYACGRSAVGLSTATTFSGLSIADTIFSGRRAARSAVLGQSEPGNDRT
ncbi:MAG: FAD-binding protein [Sphingomonadales bacterium]|nr:MAG: FAD-binding protein [Sphingomonadales bacterium]